VVEEAEAVVAVTAEAEAEVVTEAVVAVTVAEVVTAAVVLREGAGTVAVLDSR
jgi:hypothetical protein